MSAERGATGAKTNGTGLTGFLVVKSACWFGQRVIGRRKFRNDKHLVNPV